jgi:glycosyltransferase involved in cell wall biosynthesis
VNKSDYALIMGVKNAEDYIKETLQSVFAQSLLPSEILIVDDFSQDRTVEIVKSFDFDIQIFSNKRAGLSAALNQAIPKAKSTYLAFLDADDLWLPTKQEKQICFLNENPIFDVVCSAALNFKKSSSADQHFESSREFPPSRLFTASTFRKETFVKYGLLDESQTHFGWLYEWWSRAEDAGIECGQITEILFHRRIHEANSWVLQKDLAIKTVIEIARKNIAKKNDKS